MVAGADGVSIRSCVSRVSTVTDGAGVDRVSIWSCESRVSTVTDAHISCGWRADGCRCRSCVDQVLRKSCDDCEGWCRC